MERKNKKLQSNSIVVTFHLQGNTVDRQSSKDSRNEMPFAQQKHYSIAHFPNKLLYGIFDPFKLSKCQITVLLELPRSKKARNLPKCMQS